MKGLFLKALSPQLAAKAAASFDRATIMIVTTCWMGAAVMAGVSLYTVNLAVKTKHTANAAMVAEPVLPLVKTTHAGQGDVQAYLDRLQRRYPSIKFSFRGNLSVTANSGNDFHEWLSAIEYLDTVSPRLRWSLQDLCVGKCPGKALMNATLSAEKVTFEKPVIAADDK